MIAKDPRIALVSATGSTRMGKSVGAVVGARLLRALLALGGNNAIIITESAELDMRLTGSLFGAVGQAGQRGTSAERRPEARRGGKEGGSTGRHRGSREE